jgi:hypothetical protein
MTCTAVHPVTLDDVIRGSITNVATVTGYDPSTNRVTASSNEVSVALNNLPPAISCPGAVTAYTSATTCDALITSGLDATYSDPNDNVASLTWVMTGATRAASPATGINNLSSYTFNHGITDITYTVTDALRLPASCSFTVTVRDNVPPTAICRDISVDLDINNGTTSITAENVNNSSFDNCGIASMVIDKTTFDCTNVGSNNVTLTVMHCHRHGKLLNNSDSDTSYRCCMRWRNYTVCIDQRNTIDLLDMDCQCVTRNIRCQC